jgi:hypothetical protein
MPTNCMHGNGIMNMYDCNDFILNENPEELSRIQ